MKIKGFLLFNGTMFIFVFGTINLSIEMEKNIHKKLEKEIKKNYALFERIFVKLERGQNKSFYGFKNYFFSISYWHEGQKYYKLKKVSPTLFYKYKEGNQIESFLAKDRFGNHKIYFLEQAYLESALYESKFQNLETFSRVFSFLGLLMLIFYKILKK